MAGCCGNNSSNNRSFFTSSYNIELTIVEGRNLAAKDRNFFTRQRTTSDPYVVAYLGTDQRLGKTKVCSKTLNPTFDATFHFSLPNKVHKVPADTCSFLNKEEGGKMIEACGMVLLKIYDEDKMTDDDMMGTLVVPIPTQKGLHEPKWYSVDNLFVPNAEGELSIRLKIEPVTSSKPSAGGLLPSPDKLVAWTRGLLGKPEKVNEHNVVVEEAPTGDRKSYMMALFKAFS